MRHGRGKARRIRVQDRRRDFTAQTRRKCALQITVGPKSMQNQRHIGAANLGPVLDLTSQCFGQLRRRDLRQWIIL